MLKIQTSSKSLNEIPSKFCRLVLTTASATSHRFVEKENGICEYQLGVGKTSRIDARIYRTLIKSIIQATKQHQIEFLVVDFQALAFPKLTNYDEGWRMSTLIENILLANYEFTTYKSQASSKKEIKEIIICEVESKEAKTGFARGLVVGEYVNRARNIANTPACDMTPTQLAAAGVSLAKGTKIKMTILGEKELRKLKMGALLAVGQGTKSETKFIIAEYWGAGRPSASGSKTEKSPVILIGKGITYDTGGLNVKPSGSMHEMHLDMSGGSSVLAAIACAAKLGLKKNIIALVPAAENAISDAAMRAGDIVTSMSGKTIEVLHTDAEGRMILADALTYSERYHPRYILDVATLTGAALVALGQQASAIMTKDDNLSKTLTAVGEESGDLVWPLPLWDEYKQSLKSNRADVSNIATNFSRFGGAIEGGTFLSFFAPKNVPWAHIDIAPRMDSIPSDKLAKGSTGEPVRLLISFLEKV